METTEKQIQALKTIQKKINLALASLDNEAWLPTDINGTPFIVHDLLHAALVITKAA